jgi:hypothetical protein
MKMYYGACCITKATDTHSEYVIFIDFPRKQLLFERASIVTFVHISPLLLNVVSAIFATIYSVQSHKLHRDTQKKS